MHLPTIRLVSVAASAEGFHLPVNSEWLLTRRLEYRGRYTQRDNLEYRALRWPNRRQCTDL